MLGRLLHERLQLEWLGAARAQERACGGEARPVRAVQDMRLAWEEPFGPTIPVLRVKSIEEAVDHCNANNLALQGCVFTRDIDRAIAISDAMETGTVQESGPAADACPPPSPP